jgi:orotate phosphoribosyltransferase
VDKEHLGKLLYDTSFIPGDFILRSGEKSDFYLYKYKFETDPEILRQIAKYMAPLIPKESDVIAGPVLGGVPLATALSLETNLKCVFVRQEAKAHGASKIIEGDSVAGKIVCIVEDIITTGGQAIDVAKKLKMEGAIVATVICVINRNPNSVANLSREGLKLISLFSLSEIAG